MTGNNHTSDAKSEPGGQTLLEFLLVRAEEHLWAFATEMVEKVFYLDEITRIPLMPPALMGMANVGGEVIPVVNLGALDGGLPTTWRTRGNRCVLLSVDQYRFAVMTERIRQIVRIPANRRKAISDDIFSHSFGFEDRTVYQLDCEKVVRILRSAVRHKLKEAGFLPGI